ncbi:MAG: addiction module protein [Nostoc sp. S4]|nr:addiction module protein [Nostoc sp. S4]
MTQCFAQTPTSASILCLIASSAMRIWAEEAPERFQAVEQGEVTLIPGEQVL